MTAENSRPRTGADTLVQTLVMNEIDVCFANPGTSEMHFVGGLDREPAMRCVLGLFEGVVSGAADGYYRISGRPAATLLHLGPGFGNALANLHNARKARSGIVNIVGEHATGHRQLVSPLSSDIEAIVATVSDFVVLANNSRELPFAATAAIRAASGSVGAVSTLILPADISWGGGAVPRLADAASAGPAIEPGQIAAAATALRRGQSTLMLLGGDAVRGRSLELAGRIASKTGCQILSEGYNARHERGAGRVRVDRLPTTPVAAAVERLADVQELVLIGAAEPVAFFAYPDQPSKLAPKDCAIVEAVAAGQPSEQALEQLCDALDAWRSPPAFQQPLATSAPNDGALTANAIGSVLAYLMPDNAIVVDESVSTGRGFAAPTATAAPHDWLSIMGGSIGFAMPCAIGAAIAAPMRKVIALEGDGSGMYTVQALWTMAREHLDITVIIFANRRYAILENEFVRTGSGTPGPRAKAMLDIGSPDIGWVGLARAQGVEAGRASDISSFTRELRRALESSGPYLIQVDI
jgi:acetolactate synthase-1/2/3 large subunit